VTDAFVMPLRRPPVASPRGPALIPSGGGVQTNDLGEFRIHSLAAGEYYLRAAPSPGTRFANLSSTGSQRTTTLLATFFPGTTDPAAAQPVSVAAGQTAGDVVIRILTGSAFRISGIVVDEAGKPVDAAIVMLMPERPAGVPPLPAGPNQVRTDASGAFTVGGVPNGEYVLSAAAPLVLSAGKEGKTAAGFSGGVWSSFEGGSVNGGPAGGMTITETRNGRTVQYRTSRDTEQHLTVGDADVTGVQIIARRPQQP
jgi:hypothetical protein